MPDVRMPDGTIMRNVPEGTSREEIMRRYQRAQGAQRPTSFWQGVAEGITPYAANAGQIITRSNPMLNAIRLASEAMGRGDPNEAIEKQIKQGFERSPYRGSGAGKAVGAVVGSLPAMFIPGGPAAQGAYAGLLGSSSRKPRDLAANAALGAVGGKLGDMATRGIARAISPRVAPVVQRLKDRGIPMTIGQITGANGSATGKAIQNMENRLTSVPGVGNAISAAHQRGREGVQRAAFNEALSPIEATVPRLGEEGIELANREVSKAYGRALNDVRVRPDREFADEFLQAVQMGRSPGSYADDFERIMQDQVRPILTDQPGQIHGQGIQDGLRMLKGYGRQYGKLAKEGAQGIPQPSARPVGMAFDDLAGSLEALVNRQAPDVMPAYRAANQAYRNVGVLRDAVNAAKNNEGGFTVAQLSNAAKANARKYGGTHGTTNQPFFDLTSDVQKVFGNPLPNSGTADRGLLGLMLGGAGGMRAVAGSALGGIPYTKSGQKAAEWLLTGRQGPAARATAKFIESLRPAAVAAGGIGAPFLLGPSFSP